jgi:hypothetical protein
VRRQSDFDQYWNVVVDFVDFGHWRLVYSNAFRIGPDAGFDLIIRGTPCR